MRGARKRPTRAIARHKSSLTVGAFAQVPVRSSSLHGLLVVDKPGRQPATPPLAVTSIPAPAAVATDRADGAPYLLTSHDVVARVRRWSGERRIGHTGTLDPMASGVLVLCLGLATRLVEYYQAAPKQYYACLLYTSPSPRDRTRSRMPSSA